MTRQFSHYLKFFYDKLLLAESFLLVATFISVLIIAVTQIALRNFFDSGIIWADTFLRITVLWIGMMGAIIASRNNNHINMNLGLRYLSPKALPYVQAIVHFFTACVCLIVTWYSINLVSMEYEDTGMAFANIPVWVTVMIIPIGFFIMGLRYVSLSILCIIAPHHIKKRSG
ncbi:MAG: TRAP transporter small permease [Gammaproteobacteria bacterium]|nr:TRAP transporter small permease [Gammaproteobacteria bacterium]